MKIKTTYWIAAAPSVVWPLLCRSKMDSSKRCLFNFGVPKPRECKLPNGSGGVHSERHCISDKGTIRQKITTWENESRLEFEMQETDIYFSSCVESIHECFLLLPDKKGTQITRTTYIKTKGFCAFGKAFLIGIGIKQVHYYVFQNWREIAERSRREKREETA